MTRITNAIKDALVTALLSRAFKTKCEAVMSRWDNWSEEVYKDVLGKDLDKINSLPEGWLRTDTDMSVKLGNDVIKVYFGGGPHWSLPSAFKSAGISSRKSIAKRLPNKMINAVTKIYDVDHPIAAAHETIRRDEVDLSKEIEDAARTTKAVIDSVSTVKRLIAVWPEVDEFARPYLEDGERKALLPDIPRAALNKALNLPPEENEA